LRLLGASKAFENILLRYCVQVSVSALCGLWVTKRGVHCELYIRKTPASSWALERSSEPAVMLRSLVSTPINGLPILNAT